VLTAWILIIRPSASYEEYTLIVVALTLMRIVVQVSMKVGNSRSALATTSLPVYATVIRLAEVINTAINGAPSGLRMSKILYTELDGGVAMPRTANFSVNCVLMLMVATTLWARMGWFPLAG
jgi:hypothetical protein